MKLFSWMHNKLNGKKGSTKSNTVLVTNHVKQQAREEYSDWPHGLLAIGTFGNNETKQKVVDNLESQDHIQEEDSSSSDDLQDFTPEVRRLQKELIKLLSRKPKSDVEKELIANLPLDRFLNCPSSLEVDRRISNAICSDSDDKEEENIERTISVILGRCKDIRADNSKRKSIGKKSISFLLKKIFVCSSGFATQPSLRDTFQESRMEKLLRALLQKKMNPQNSPSRKKFLEDKKPQKRQNEEETQEKNNEGCKWVKTDSEYIVLEI